METNKAKTSKIIEGGMEDFEKTTQYNLKIAEIKNDLTAKYSDVLAKETNWIKRFLIEVRLSIEISRKIRELSSRKNLHAAEFSQTISLKA
jgi:hypothetical protein